MKYKTQKSNDTQIPSNSNTNGKHIENNDFSRVNRSVAHISGLFRMFARNQCERSLLYWLCVATSWCCRFFFFLHSKITFKNDSSKLLATIYFTRLPMCVRWKCVISNHRAHFCCCCRCYSFIQLCRLHLWR